MLWNVSRNWKELKRLRKLQLDDGIRVYGDFAATSFKISKLEAEINFAIQLITVSVSVGVLIVTTIFSLLENRRENADFQMRNRPYLVVAAASSTPLGHGLTNQYVFRLQNVGILPAKVIDTDFLCSGSPAGSDVSNLYGHNIIGNGESQIVNFAISSEFTSNIECFYTTQYTAPTSNGKDKVYETKYKLILDINGKVIPQDAWMK